MSNKNVVIGVTGGIAVYKSLDVISRLKKNNINVDVIMTNSACEFVNPLSFQALSQNMVITDMFEEPKVWEIQHISLAKKADVMLICPATANIIGKVASGIADDMLSTTIMATKSKVIFAPAMNTNMWNNPIVQGNIKKLKEYGYEFIEPASGRLACGDIGGGKLADTELISHIIESKLYDKKDLLNKKVVVTAGPTIAAIDPVRFITNRSTGKMGYAIAEEARDRGAEVILISGPTAIKKPFGIEVIDVTTNEDMKNAVLSKFDHCDYMIKSAAVADYKPCKYSKSKIKKQEGNLFIELERDNDILLELGKRKVNQVLVGFAAESECLIQNAEGKLSKKNLDYIVANNISNKNIGFASDNNSVTVLGRDNFRKDIEICSKKEVARHIFDILTK